MKHQTFHRYFNMKKIKIYILKGLKIDGQGRGITEYIHLDRYHTNYSLFDQCFNPADLDNDSDGDGTGFGDYDFFSGEGFSQGQGDITLF